MIKIHYDINSLSKRVSAALLAMLLILATLTSCSGTEEPGGDTTATAMSFKADFSTTRQATVNVDDNYRLWLSAIHNGTGGGSLFFNGTDRLELDYNSATGKFEATGWYYPLNGTIDFRAFACNSKKSRTRAGQYPWVNIDTGGGVFGVMTIDLTDGSSPGGDNEDNTRSSRSDATSGDRAFDGSYEVMFAMPVNNHPCGSYVGEPTLHFKHPMANIRFHFQAADEATSKHLRINYIEIRNAHIKGKCIVAPDGTFHWDDVRTETDNKVPVNNFNPGEDDKPNIPYSKTDLSVGLYAGNGVYVIPQTERSNDDNRTQIVVNYTIYNDADLHTDATNDGWNNGHIGDKNEETGETSTDWGKGSEGYKDDDVRNLFYVVPDKQDFDWEAGNCYLYHIYVRGNCQMDLIDVNVKPIVDADIITPMHI